MRRSVADGGVDDLSLPGLAGAENRRDDAESEIDGAGIIADEIERRARRRARAADRMKGAADGDVIEIVARRLGERPLLAPPGHAPVNEARIAGEKRPRAETEPFHHARSKAFNERVRLVDETQRRLDALLPLEVERERFSAAQQEVVARRFRHAEAARLPAIDANHLRSEFRQ